ncbi:flagellar basal body L-ring protein FlgH [Sandarakinorhabdus sp. AAP62]|uniref:flagellar basal body L-ring protein FlgH n=1 Tax=Sandarakinorhabdus sp. AAP62 TaxID=1248916 RepID=UPI00030E94DC|nr:flagellar basal body L-ring protein FlgH [Sandarakinorhabdus sp. AAP62]
MSERQSAQLSLACWLLASAILFVLAQPAFAAKKLRPIPPAVVAAPVLLAIPTGSLFNAQYFSGLVTDRRARRVGDLITIRLVERTRASKSASAESGRESDNALRFPPAIPFADTLNRATQGGATQSFSGSGSAEQNNELFGEITVTVAEVLPGGVLRIAGEKRLMLNRGEEHLKLTGLVRIDDLGFDNVVPSTRVADARIRFGGTGQVADNSRQGWLARFFARISPL